MFTTNRLKVLLLLAVLSLMACADENVVVLGPQEWQEFTVLVETRPSPVHRGMNEFIAIINHEVFKRGTGLIVSFRLDDRKEFRQAIQDGYSGVYRRAMLVIDPQGQSLSLHLRRKKPEKDGEEEGILVFPLNQKKTIKASG